MFRWFDFLVVNDAGNLSEEPANQHFFHQDENASLPLFPFAHDEVTLQGWPKYSCTIYWQTYPDDISNMCIQDAQRAVSVGKKDQPMTQAAGPQTRATYLYEADPSATMAGAIMRRMLLAGWDLSYLLLFLVEDNNVIILYIFPIQLLEYQTDVRRCRFDINIKLGQCSACTWLMHLHRPLRPWL